MDSRELNLSQLPNFARDLAGEITRGTAILLYGPPSAGKTTLARAIIAALTQDDVEVQSPTFPICLTYDSPVGIIWHYDLYRLDSDSSLDDLGWGEARSDGIAIVEWPERMHARYMTAPVTRITLSEGPDDLSRHILIERDHV